MHRIFTTAVASVYPHYVTKVERKGRTQAELDEVIRWLTGYDEVRCRNTWRRTQHSTSSSLMLS